MSKLFDDVKSKVKDATEKIDKEELTGKVKDFGNQVKENVSATISDFNESEFGQKVNEFGSSVKDNVLDAADTIASTPVVSKVIDSTAPLKGAIDNIDTKEIGGALKDLGGAIVKGAKDAKEGFSATRKEMKEKAEEAKAEAAAAENVEEAAEAAAQEVVETAEASIEELETVFEDEEISEEIQDA